MVEKVMNLEQLKKSLQVNTGWNRLTNRLAEDIAKILGDDLGYFRLNQVKEKFGSLRIYHGLDTPCSIEVKEELSDRIEIAGLESSLTCHECGENTTARIKMRDGTWFIPICVAHTGPADLMYKRKLSKSELRMTE